MTENTAKEVQSPESRIPPQKELSRFEKMVELDLWTNRLDGKLKVRLGDLKICFSELRKHIATLQPSAEKENLLRAAERAYQELYPELVELCVVRSEHLYLLDALATDLRQRLERLTTELRTTKSSPFFLCDQIFIEPFRKLRRKIHAFFQENSDDPTTTSRDIIADIVHNAQAAEPREHRELENRVGAIGTYNVYAAVDNSQTALSIFDEWVTSFRYNGRLYGSQQPIVHDHSTHLVALHEYFDFKGKTILELGPFEAANTKQLADMGAKNVVAIEANPEFFLKCLLVKNEFKLNNVEFRFGDCNRILESVDFRKCGLFDICIASGILYHMADPLHLIDLISETADSVYIWTHIASETMPTGDWTEIKDCNDRPYRARRNVYTKNRHWGGVAPSALWLVEEDLLRAFEHRGFETKMLERGESGAGKFISFIAKR